MDRLTFNSGKWQGLVQHLYEMMPGLQQVHLITEHQNKVTRFRRGVSDSEFSSFPPIPERLPQIQRFRSLESNHEWIGLSEIPWNERTDDSPLGGTLQLSLSANEDEVAFLVIRLDSRKGSGLKDCIVMELDIRMHHYGISRQGEFLNPGNRKIVELLAYRQITAWINQFEKDHQLFRELKSRIEAERTELQELRSGMERKQAHYSQSVVGYVESLLQSFSREQKVRFSLDDSARQKLSVFEGPFEWLQSAVKAAAGVALNLSEESDETVIIKAGDLLLDRPPKTATNSQSQVKSSTTSPDRYASTMDFLDRYEEAAQKLEKEGKSVTGKNIAAYCQPAVSPPAISDVLKKHKVKIKHLVKKQPKRWPLLLESFRPLQRLIDDEDMPQSKEKTA